MPFTDYLNSLRFDQLFGDGSMPNYDVSQGVPMNQIMAPEPTMAMQPQFQPQQYQPEHQASDILSNQLTHMPQRPNPSMVSKIFAGIAGLSGGDARANQDNIMYGNFNRGVQDWQTRTGVAAQAANLERQNNVLAKSAFDTNENRRITQQRADEYVRRGDTAQRTADANIKDKEAKAKIEQQKLELLDFKTKNPHYVFKTGGDGFIYGLNPQNGKSVKTDIKTGDLNDMQKHQLQLELIEARGDEARETATTVADLPPRAIAPTTTTTDTTDNTGKKTTTVKTVKPVASHGSGKMVQMWGPGGQGPYNVPEEKVEEAKKTHQMKTSK